MMTSTQKARLRELCKRDVSSLSREERAEVTALLDRDAYERVARKSAGTPEPNGYGPVSKTGSAHDRAFDRYLRFGELSGDLRYAADAPELRTDPPGFSDGTQPGQVLGTGGTFGGYMVAQGFWDNLQLALKAYGNTAADYRKIETPTGAVMPWPTLDPTAQVASVLTPEPASSNVALVPDNPYVLGQGVLGAWPYVTKPVLVSLALMQDSEFDASQLVAQLFAEQIGRGIAQHAITGSGAGQPLGITTALAAASTTGTVNSGTPTPTGGWLQMATAQTVKTFGGTPTEIAGQIPHPDTLLALAQSVDIAYHHTQYGDAKYYMHPAMVYNVRGATDAQGRPLYNLQDGLSQGAAYRLFGFDVVPDPNVSLFTASQVSGPIFGNLGHTMIQRTVRSSGFMRLNERYADFWSVGFLGWLRTDIRSNDLRSAVQTKCAAT